MKASSARADGGYIAPMTFRLRLSLFVLLALVMPAGAFAQNTIIRVRVVRADSQPIAGVLVQLDSVRQRTDTGGEARLSIAAGSRTVRVTRIGYSPDSAALVLRAGALRPRPLT